MHITDEAETTKPHPRLRIDPTFLRWFVVINCAVPAGMLAYDAWREQLGANGVNYALRTTGLLALLFLTLSLTITPLKRILGWTTIVAPRRALGLYGFGYLVVHFAIFFTFDRSASLSSTVHEILSRRYLQIGSIALLLLIPLAITSTDGMITRLGPRRWKRLHRLAYVATGLGCLHYVLLVKSDLRQPLVFAGAVSLLLLFRVSAHYVDLRAQRAKRKAPPAPTLRKFWSGKLRIARAFDETPDVRTFRLVPPDGGPLPFAHMAGQYLNLALTIDGKRVNRSYTIASSPTRSTYCEITVKRAERGYASHHLHTMLHEGSVLDVSAPAGRFTFEGQGDEHVVFIAGGVGITPLMSMLRALTDRCWPGRIDLVFAAKTAADIIFREELAYLTSRFPNVRLSVVLSREPKDSEWAGERGQITRELMARVVPDLSKAPIFLCGPGAMMAAIQDMLAGMGVPASHVHIEAFVSPPPAAEPPTAEPGEQEHEPFEEAAATATVRFESSGVTADLRDGKTLLEAAEEAGVDLPFDCRSGICGQCKTELLEGRVVMQVQDALTQSDRKKHLILACQARAVTDVVLNA